MSSMLFFCGLIAGSFAGALLYRLPTGQSVWGPRSRCTSCRRELGAADLVPLLSYIWLRGRCRYCFEAISLRYPALELACGLTAGTAGSLGGWAFGFTVIGLWIAGAVAVGLLRRRRLAGREGGFTLVEVLVSVTMLTLVAGSLFETIKISRNSALVAQRRTVTVALARQVMAEVASGAKNVVPVSAPLTAMGDFEVETVVAGFRTPNTYLVTVYVCLPGKCAGSPPVGAEVTLTGVVCRCKRT